MSRKEMKRTINNEIVKTEVNAYKTARFCNNCMAVITGSVAVLMVNVAAESVAELYSKFSKNKKSDKESENAETK